MHFHFFVHGSFWKGVSVDMHASLHKSRRENHGRVVFTQQETIYSCAHLVLTNSLITSLLVLCFSRWFLLSLPPTIILISCHPRLLIWYLLFRYRWAHHLCFLSMNDLSQSSFFGLCQDTKSDFLFKILGRQSFLLKRLRWKLHSTSGSVLIYFN